MPMFTTLRMRLPVWPVKAPLRRRVAKSAIASSTLWTSGTTSAPSTSMRVPRGARSATCSTARRSVVLIFSPANIASRRCRHAALFGKPQQQPQRLVGDAVLRVVEEEARTLGREALRPAGIVGEQRAQMHVLDLRMMRRERLPGWRGGQSGHRHSPRFRPGPCSWRRSPRAVRATNRRSPWRRRIAVAPPAPRCRCPPWHAPASAAAASPPSRGSALPVVP